MLEEQLNPILNELRAKQRDWNTSFQIVREWFVEREENLASNLIDMTFICELPNHERKLLAHPVIGNWYLDKMEKFDPQTEHQEETYKLLRNLVLEKRFNNHHTDRYYNKHEEFNLKVDEFNSLMLSKPTESLELHDIMENIDKEIRTAVYDRHLPHKDTYTIDLGHGLSSPSSAFSHLTWYFEAIIRYGQAEPLDLKIMVVDDQHPKAWYERMISVGFKHEESQQGYFFDCESALEALEKERYDVILSDLELGEGKMGGIEFVERAFEIQREKGIEPLISVFSYNNELLQEAEYELRGFNSDDPKVFHQVNYNNKTNFSAIKFRRDVGGKLYY